jgi:cellobiose-specific phosphotransferase system component IIA
VHLHSWLHQASPSERRHHSQGTAPGWSLVLMHAEQKLVKTGELSSAAPT